VRTFLVWGNFSTNGP